MLYRKQLYESVKHISVGLILFLYSVSLVLPHSSAYFCRDGLRAQTESHGNEEKIQLATSLFTSPAEIGVAQRVTIVHIFDNFIFRLIDEEIASRQNASLKKTAWFIPDASYSVYQWHPSIVIALRKLVI